MTPVTIVERSRLEEEFTAIRERGYALSQGEVFSEVAGMAAPVFNHEGSVCGSITIADPIQRFTEDRQQEMLDSLLVSARKLSQLLGNEG